MTKEDNWTENHITKSKDDKQFIVWDETSSEEVGRTDTYDQAVKLVDDYGHWLNTEANKHDKQIRRMKMIKWMLFGFAIVLVNAIVVLGLVWGICVIVKHFFM